MQQLQSAEATLLQHNYASVQFDDIIECSKDDL